MQPKRIVQGKSNVTLATLNGVIGFIVLFEIMIVVKESTAKAAEKIIFCLLMPLHGIRATECTFSVLPGCKYGIRHAVN